MIGEMSPPQGTIFDRLHVWTTPINQYFHEHPQAANIVLISTSLWIDASILFLCLRALFGPSIRPFLELFFFALYRECLQFLVTLPVPQGIIWEYPGFPSLMVNYSVQHDLYFSGHTGVALLIMAEFVRTKLKWFSAISFLFFGYVVMTIISFRIHYTMDVFTGVLVALYVIYTSERLSLPIDRFLQKWPIRK